MDFFNRLSAVVETTVVSIIPVTVAVWLAVFVITAFVGAVIQAQVVWDVSDLFNGLMAIPNLVAIILLRKEVKADI